MLSQHVFLSYPAVDKGTRYLVSANAVLLQALQNVIDPPLKKWQLSFVEESRGLIEING